MLALVKRQGIRRYPLTPCLDGRNNIVTPVLPKQTGVMCKTLHGRPHSIDLRIQWVIQSVLIEEVANIGSKTPIYGRVPKAMTFETRVHDLCIESASEFPGWNFASGVFKNKALKHTTLTLPAAMSSCPHAPSKSRQRQWQMLPFTGSMRSVSRKPYLATSTCLGLKDCWNWFRRCAAIACL